MAFADDAALTFKIRADASQGRREVSSFRKGVKDELDGLTPVLTSNAGAFGRIAAGAGLAGAAIGVAGGVAVTAAAGVFTLAKNAADAGSRINDLSIKTGLSAETLSGLDLQAKQSGTSLEALSAGVFALQRNMASAAGGNKELAKTFADLNVDISGTTEDALRQLFVSLAAIPDEGKRNAEGARVMGRAYRELSVLFADVNGDMDAVIERARELGLVISGDAARAADRFGDSLDQLDNQLSGLARQVGGALVPEITRAIEDLSGVLAGNQRDWAGWQESIAFNVAAARAVAARFAAEARAFFSTDVFVPGRIGEIGRAAQNASIDESRKRFDANQGRYFDLTGTIPLPSDGGRELQKALRRAGVPRRGPAGASSAAPAVPRRRGGSGSRRVESNADDIASREDERDYQQAVADARRDFDLKKTNIEQLTNVQEAAEERRFIALRDGLLKQRTEIKAHGQERLNKEREIDDKLVDLQRETDNNIRRYRDDRAKAETDAEREFVKARSDIADERSRREIERLRAEAEERVIVQSEAEERIGALQLEMHDRRVKLLRDGLNAELEGSAEHRRLQGEVSVAEVERAGIIEETERRVRAARAATQEQQERFARRLQGEGFQNRSEDLDVRRREIEAAAQFGTRRIDIIRELTENAREAERLRHEQALASLDAQKSELLSQAETFDQYMEVLRVFHERKEIEQRRHQQAMGQINAEGKEQERGAEFLGPLRDAIGETADFTTFASQKIADAYQHIEGALGHATKAYVLYGASIGKALKQAFAEVLANVAAEAAIQSLKHAAYAIGNLAIGNFASAAKHSAAAAAFGALAYGSASLGRSLVRSQESGGQSAAGGAVRERGGGRSSDDVRVIEESRYGTRPQAPVVQRQEVHYYYHEERKVQVTPPAGWVVNEVVESYHNDGPMRDVIRRGAEG